MTKPKTGVSPGAYSQRPAVEERIPVPDLKSHRPSARPRTVDDVQSPAQPVASIPPRGVWGSTGEPEEARPEEPTPSERSSRPPRESGVVAKSERPGTLRGFRAPLVDRAGGSGRSRG